MNIDGNGYISDLGAFSFFDNIHRREYFSNKFQPFKYLADNARIIVRIGKFLAVHGGLYPDAIKKFNSDEFNNNTINVLNYMFMKTIYNKKIDNKSRHLIPFIDDNNDEYLMKGNQSKTNTIYWNRYFGETFTNKIYDVNDRLCINTDKLFKKLCDKTDCVEHIIISHCPNYFYNYDNQYSFTFIRSRDTTNRMYRFDFTGDKVERREHIDDNYDDKEMVKHYFGISADCGIYNGKKAVSAKICRLDIGMSREFGNFDTLNLNTIKRLPQVLIFDI
jgi:hypothetical protein